MRATIETTRSLCGPLSAASWSGSDARWRPRPRTPPRLDLFRTLKPDLVTLDIVMAETDEIDSLSAFRAMREEAPETQYPDDRDAV